MDAVILYGASEHDPALRHELPVAIGDPFLLVETGGRLSLMSNALERQRMAAARPEAELIDIEELGFHELVDQGLNGDDVMLELVSRMVARLAVSAAVVDFAFPLALADRLRSDGVTLRVDEQAVRLRRRVKSEGERAGIIRATRAAEAGLAAASALLARAERGPRDQLVLDGRDLTAEAVRAAVRAACAAAGAPASADLMVVSVWQGLSHDPGSGPLPAGLPIQIDLWPQDELSGCFTDMTRTFLAAGTVPAEIRRQERIVAEVRAALLSAIRPGVLGNELYAIACEIFEREGYATARTERGESGFQFALGHGVGLAVHEPPGLGRTGRQPLVDGDVIAVEPGLWDTEVGGYRYEDTLLVTADGCKPLSTFPYAIAVG